MWIYASGHGEKTVVRPTIHSDSAIVVGNVFEEPVHGVISISALVDKLGVAMINHGAAHDESALRFESAANILKNKNVATGSEFWLRQVDVLWSRPVLIHSIRRAPHEEG